MIDHQRPAHADEAPRSACYGDLRFTSNKPGDIAEAIAICGGCTFKACIEELAYARTDVTVWQNIEGVYNGRYYSPNSTGKAELVAVGKKRPALTRPPCGTEKGYQWHRQQKAPVWPLPLSDDCGCRAAHREHERGLAAERKKRRAVA